MGQKGVKDTTAQKEGVAVAEFGGATSVDVKGGGASFGFNASVEVTPIENWLELELGVSPTFASHLTDVDIDLLFKKPWTFSPKAEFMFGVGLAYDHIIADGLMSNTLSGEIALDFMFWAKAQHKFGWYLEPAYQYSFAQGHDQSIGMSAGLLIAIP